MKNETPEEYGYEAKFSVRTDFLDTTFRRSRQQREGETYAQFVAETHAIFVGMVQQLQTQEAAMRQFLGVQNPPTEFRYSEPHASPSSPMPIIDKKWDQFEVDIDNAPTQEALDELIKQHEVFPARFIPAINTKRAILKLEANNKSMGEKNSR